MENWKWEMLCKYIVLYRFLGKVNVFDIKFVEFGV